MSACLFYNLRLKEVIHSVKCHTSSMKARLVEQFIDWLKTAVFCHNKN